MTTLPGTHAQRYDRRVVGFRIVAGLIAIGLLLLDGIGIVAPWVDLASYHLPAFQGALRGWYQAQRGAYAGILCTGSLLALLWRPHAQPLLLQFLMLSGPL
jgi:cytochrome c biogenesis protein CcdA